MAGAPTPGKSISTLRSLPELENQFDEIEKTEMSKEDVEAIVAITRTEANMVTVVAPVEPLTDPEKVDSEKAVGFPPSHPLHPSQFPDGGRDAWLCVLGGFCCLFVSFGWINCVGIFQHYYQTHQLKHDTPSTISWITSLETFMIFGMGPIVGKLIDNYGPRYVLMTGSFLHVFGLLMTSISTEYYQFILAQGICSPMGASAIFYSATTSLTSWFLKRRALAFGVMVAGSSLAGIVLPIMISHLALEVGFGWAMRSAAFLILFLLIIANLTVKSRLIPRPRPVDLRDFIHPLREITYALYVSGAFLFFLGNFVPYTYLIVQASSHGMSTHLQAFLLPILNAAGFFGRLIPGHIADHVGRFNVIIIMCGFTGLVCLAIWIPATSNGPVIFFAAMYGFGGGAFVSLSSACVAQITKDLSRIGVRNGTAAAIYSIGALAGAPIGGAILLACGGKFWGLQVFAGVVQLAGTCFLIAARISIVGWKLKVKV